MWLSSSRLKFTHHVLLSFLLLLLCDKFKRVIYIIFWPILLEILEILAPELFKTSISADFNLYGDAIIEIDTVFFRTEEKRIVDSRVRDQRVFHFSSVRLTLATDPTSHSLLIQH